MQPHCLENQRLVEAGLREVVLQQRATIRAQCID
jgi:hypothetical protein